MYLLAPFILQNFKRILRVDSELSERAIFRHKVAHLSCPEQFIFFSTNHYYYFHLPVGPFHCAKFAKNYYSWSKVVRMSHFWVQNGPFAPLFLENYYHFHLLSPFIVQNFKKILPVDPELWGCAIFWHKMDHLPKWDFFQKTC